MNESTMSDEQREIAADIEATRERLGETVEELAHRLDVKAQMQEKVDETKQAVHDKVDHTKEAVAAKIDDTKEVVQEKVAEARESVQAAVADPKTALTATAERFRGAASEAARRRDIQIAAGVAALSGLAGAILLRRGH